MAHDPFAQSSQGRPVPQPTMFDPITQAEAQAAIAAECDALKQFLLDKNLKYGNSALEPLRVFSRATVTEQILVRLDDKLSRLARGAGTGPDEDTVLDMIGYLVLLRVHTRLRGTVAPTNLSAGGASDGALGGSPVECNLACQEQQDCKQVCETLALTTGPVAVEDLVVRLNANPGQLWTEQYVHGTLSILAQQRRVIWSYDYVTLAPLGYEIGSPLLDEDVLTKINLQHGALFNAARHKKVRP